MRICLCIFLMTSQLTLWYMTPLASPPMGGLVNGGLNQLRAPPAAIHQHIDRSGQSSLTYLGALAHLPLLILLQSSLFSNAEAEPSHGSSRDHWWGCAHAIAGLWETYNEWNGTRVCTRIVGINLARNCTCSGWRTWAPSTQGSLHHPWQWSDRTGDYTPEPLPED